MNRADEDLFDVGQRLVEAAPLLPFRFTYSPFQPDLKSSPKLCRCLPRKRHRGQGTDFFTLPPGKERDHTFHHTRRLARAGSRLAQHVPVQVEYDSIPLILIGRDWEIASIPGHTLSASGMA
jgi:hypothetical protein